MFREIAFAASLFVACAGFSIGLGLLAGPGPALMAGSILFGAWSWFALSDTTDDEPESDVPDGEG